MAQWPVCSAQNTDTNVNASSDGSGCKSQGSPARQRSSVRARSGTTTAANNGGWEVQGAAIDQQQGHAGLQLRLKLGCRQGQWRLGYCGSEQAAGTALTALVVALLWEGDMK